MPVYGSGGCVQTRISHLLQPGAASLQRDKWVVRGIGIGIGIHVVVDCRTSDSSLVDWGCTCLFEACLHGNTKGLLTLSLHVPITSVAEMQP